MSGYRSEQGSFKSYDETKIHYGVYSKESNSNLVLIIHGKGEHSGRYGEVIDNLLGWGYDVAVMDLRGHGKSSGPDVFVNTFSDFLRDTTIFTELLSQKFPKLNKLTLIGHSLGGLIAFNWACQNPNRIKAVILSSPCFGLRCEYLIGLINCILHKITPGFYYLNPIKGAFLTHDTHKLDAYYKDALIKKKISVRLLNEMIRTCRKTRKIKRVPFNVGMLLAGDEKIVSRPSAMKFFNQLNAPQKRLFVFEGLYHEIFYERERNIVFEKLKSYLKELAV